MSIPGHQGSDRVRIWRALKGLGTCVLRDGVYLAPAIAGMRSALNAQREAVAAVGGKAHIFHHSDPDTLEDFAPLFDRSGDYAALLERISNLRDELAETREPEARRRQAQLRRDLDSIRNMDFFPGQRSDEAISAMAGLDEAINRQFSPDEPGSQRGELPRIDAAQFRGRVWATRKNIWIDRIASAWLIKRFIDPAAKFVWLEKTSDRPPEAVSFDFDGADFSHVNELVTYEVLLHCFGLEGDAALARIGTMVNFLDTGGVPVPEASGFATMLAGARYRHQDDDALLSHAGAMLDFMYDAYTATA